MSCESVSSKLSAFLDEELDLLELLEVQQHIAGCENCREQLHSFERLGEELRNTEAPIDIDSMWSSIENRLEAARPPTVFLA